jgi:hypothetical protein
MKLRGRHPRLAPGIALLAAMLLGAPAVLAQTTSSLRGTVTGDSGAVAGATVEAVEVASGFRRVATSGANGGYRINGLEPGVYRVSASMPSFAAEPQVVQILLGQDVQADFRLSSATFTEQVSVVGESPGLLVDTRTSAIATNVTPAQIETLPQNSRNFLSFASLAPGVNFTDDQDQAGQKFRSGAQDARQVNVFIDGLSYKNDVLQGGAFMQDSARGNPFPQNAVQEFRVLTQNYKAEYEKAAAAVITAVTKSGGNEYHGDAFWLFQDKGLVEQDDFSKERGESKPDYDRDQFGLSIGGPLVRDKAHFFVSYEGNRQDRNATIFRGPEFGNAPPDVQQFLGGFETGVLTSPLDSDLFFGKVSWQPSTSQTLFVTAHVRDEQEVRGFGGQRTRDGAESFEIGTEAVVAKHTWVLGNALNELTATVQQQEWSPTALNLDAPRQNFIGILDVGGKDATQDFTQDRLGLRDDYTYLADWHGSHTLKGGVGVSQLSYDVTKRQFDNPLFEYRSGEQWEFPFQARIGFGDPTLSFDNTQLGLYVQDDWQILDNLTLNLGLRWDYESNMLNNDFRTPPELVAALESACRTYGQPVGGQTDWCLRDFLDLGEFTTDGNDRDAYTGMIQPRLGFAWDVKSDGQTVVFGGWGKYYDRVILNDIFDEEYRQQWRIYSFCFSADGGPAPNCGVPALQWQDSYLSADALRELIASGRAPGPEVFLVSNDLRPPRTDQWTLGVRQQLGKWLASLSYAGVRGYNGLIYFFGDNPPGTAFADRFGGNVPVPGYARVFVTSSARSNSYDGIYLTLDRPLSADGRWGFNFAYTYAEGEQTGTDNPGEGIFFGAFDYGTSADLFEFPATGIDRHRVVASGTVLLPARFLVSSIVTLGSGAPFTIFDDSQDPFTVRWNEGRPAKDDFIAPDAFAYQSVDARLEWQAPPIKDVAITLIGEGFNLLDHDNGGCFESFKPRLPAVNARFGEPNCELNTRRFQLGARVAF